jgi:NodT family efflux transporter outer membrane factor (OMF) lipoprotein
MAMKRKLLLRSVVGLMGLALLASGCTTVGPDYIRPDAPSPNEWIEKDDPRIQIRPGDFATWWKVFNDPILETLIEKAYHQNLNLRIAGIRILEARAILGIDIGNFYPQTQRGLGTYGFTRLSENTANTTSGIDSNYSELSLGFDAAWEIDLWGKFRRGIEASLADLDAAVASYDDILVFLTAEVARGYVLIRTIESRLNVARETVRIQERTVEIAQAVFDGGEVTELDVAQARTLLSNTKATVPPLEASLRQAQNGLSVLLGMLPGQVRGMLGGPKPIPVAPPEVAVGIPAELLRRRPDVRLAERQVAAQSPRIGVAKADLYPHFALFGTIGVRASDAALTAAGFPGGSKLGDLFSSKSFEWFAGPAFSWDLFNYGRIKNRVRAEDARFQQLAINYQNTVLRAAQETEDALVAFLRSQDEQAFLMESVNASKRSVDLSSLQYKEGLVDYQRVLDAQRALLIAEDAFVNATGAVAINLITTYKALGGGWEIRLGKDFVPSEVKDEMRVRTNWGDLLAPEEVEPKPEKIEKVLPPPDW